MATNKIAITIEGGLLREVDRMVGAGRFPNRSRAIQEALRFVIDRWKHRRLAAEAARLDPRAERREADFFGRGEAPWPGY